jgi:hypothetical protein
MLHVPVKGILTARIPKNVKCLRFYFHDGLSVLRNHYASPPGPNGVSKGHIWPESLEMIEYPPIPLGKQPRSIVTPFLTHLNLESPISRDSISALPRNLRYLSCELLKNAQIVNSNVDALFPPFLHSLHLKGIVSVLIFQYLPSSLENLTVVLTNAGGGRWWLPDDIPDVSRLSHLPLRQLHLISNTGPALSDIRMLSVPRTVTDLKLAAEHVHLGSPAWLSAISLLPPNIQSFEILPRISWYQQKPILSPVQYRATRSVFARLPSTIHSLDLTGVSWYIPSQYPPSLTFLTLHMLDRAISTTLPETLLHLRYSHFHSGSIRDGETYRTDDEIFGPEEVIEDELVKPGPRRSLALSWHFPASLESIVGAIDIPCFGKIVSNCHNLVKLSLNLPALSLVIATVGNIGQLPPTLTQLKIAFEQSLVLLEARIACLPSLPLLKKLKLIHLPHVPKNFFHGVGPRLETCFLRFDTAVHGTFLGTHLPLEEWQVLKCLGVGPLVNFQDTHLAPLALASPVLERLALYDQDLKVKTPLTSSCLQFLARTILQLPNSPLFSRDWDYSQFPFLESLPFSQPRSQGGWLQAAGGLQVKTPVIDS